MFTFNDLLSHTIDVQGFSHQNRAKAQACHKALPDKPCVPLIDLWMLDPLRVPVTYMAT